MRIVGGEFRSRRIEAPKGRTTRPIPDPVKLALANILRGHFDGVAVLDLFAGTGAIGLEAISRGAARCLFVERDKAALAALRRNIDALGVRDRAEVIQGDALGLSIPARAPRPLHLLFLDPPYELVRAPHGWNRLRDQMARLIQLLDHDGFAVLRTPAPFTHQPENEGKPPADPDMTIDGADGPETHVYRNTAVHLYAPRPPNTDPAP